MKMYMKRRKFKEASENGIKGAIDILAEFDEKRETPN